MENEESATRSQKKNNVGMYIFLGLWVFLTFYALHKFFLRRNPCHKGFGGFFRNLGALFTVYVAPYIYILYAWLNPKKDIMTMCAAAATARRNLLLTRPS